MVILNRMPILFPRLTSSVASPPWSNLSNEQKARQRAHLAELDTLFASLQTRAFRGDL